MGLSAERRARRTVARPAGRSSWWTKKWTVP